MDLPGPNQTLLSERRARNLATIRAIRARPAPRRSLAGAMAQGLQLCVHARDAGYADGLAGDPFGPGNHDLISYAAGYVTGHQFSTRNKGD